MNEQRRISENVKLGAQYFIANGRNNYVRVVEPSRQFERVRRCYAQWQAKQQAEQEKKDEETLRLICDLLTAGVKR